MTMQGLKFSSNLVAAKPPLVIIMQGLKFSSNLVAANPPSAIIIVPHFFKNAVNYGCSVTFGKILDQPESRMRYTFTY